jgi:hypothetical protein
MRRRRHDLRPDPQYSPIHRQAFPLGNAAVMEQTKPHCNDHLNLNSSQPEHVHWDVPLILASWVPACEQIASRLALTLPPADRLHQITIAAYDATWLMVKNSAEPHTLAAQYRFILFFLLHCLIH